MELVAVIDLGSNSVRLSIAVVEKGSYKNIFMKKNMIKLSENMNSDMLLKKPAMQRAVDALCEFSKIISDYGCTKIISVATAAVRKAKNQANFLEYVKRNTGIEIKVIDGLNEAKLDFYGVLGTVSYNDFLIMDIGGGSTEIIAVTERNLSAFVSIPMGSRSITEEFLTPETSENVINAKRFVDEEIQRLEWLSEYNKIPVIGLGGCLRAAGKTLSITEQLKFESGISFEAYKVIDLYERLKNLNVRQRTEIDGIGKSRGDIILGGLMPFISVSEKINATNLLISDSGIRDGILYALCNSFELFQ